MSGEEAVTFVGRCDRDGCSADIVWRGVKEQANFTNYAATTCPCDTPATGFAGVVERARGRRTEEAA